jgi:predicted PhzF superfamily epimerase YddE/YHI9
MRHHDSNGRYLAIHSVAVDEKYRKCGVGSAMLKDYWEAMERWNKSHVERKKAAVPMEKIVMIAKKELLAFYVRNGFSVTKVSDIVHGKDEWFELERKFTIQGGGRECYLIDAFVDPSEKEGRSGNPAGVVLLEGPPGLDVEEEEKKQRKMSNVESCGSLDAMNVEEEEKQNSIPVRGCEWMSAVAKELNQSETAFVWPLAADMMQYQLSNGFNISSLQHGENMSSASSLAYAIRYYTRTGVEVDLCGHATLASASVLLNYARQQRNKLNTNKVSFYAKNDVLHAELLPFCSPTDSSTNSTKTQIAMNFPWKKVTPVQSGSGRDAVLDIISRAFFGAGATSAVNATVNPEESSVAAKFRQFFNPKDPDLAHHILYIGTTDGEEDLFLELTEVGFDLLRGINVNHLALCEWSGYSRGVIICCSCGSSSVTTSTDRPSSAIQQPTVDFRSRFFGPKVGIDEDPVTGSAHCSLGPYFGAKLNKTVVVGRQESERGGLVECTLKPEEGRVGIVGTAVRTMAGKMSIRI